tara:strand:- start:112 stop:321 length:210 start_codon:yes stop_codon:yes gene_type:complete
MSDNNFFGTSNTLAAMAVRSVIAEAQKENWNWGQTESRLYNLSPTDGDSRLWEIREGRVTREVKKYLFG